jgi:Domain of unknown function (DUF6881)
LSGSHIKVVWKHDFVDEPVVLYCELDEERLETRKVWLLRDGRTRHADADSETDDFFLSEGPIEPLDQIAADPQFAPFEIDRDEFDAVWRRAGCA